MTVNISTTARNVAGDAIIALLDNGDINLNPYIEIRTGTKPISPQLPATGTLLAKLILSNPSFAKFVNGISGANPILPNENIDETGKAEWFRGYDRNGVPVFDGDITTIGGGGDIEFDNVNFLKGGTVQITSLSAIMPQ